MAAINRTLRRWSPGLHAAQAIQIIRRRQLSGKKKWSREIVYAVTSLTTTQASPAGLAAAIRHHARRPGRPLRRS
jgi:hypothetical protein